MITVRLPARPNAGARGVADMPSGDANQNDQYRSSLLDGELLDLYAAIAIVVPLALFLKSLWS